MESEFKTNERIRTALRLRNLCFLLYFVILFVERLLGGILGIFRGEGESMIYSETFIPKLVHPLALLAIALGVVFMWRQWLPLLRSVFGKNEGVDPTALSCGIGFFLLSGMLHTGFLVLAAQFTAYGILAIGLILHAVSFEGKATAKDRAFACAYIISFSMTVPVVYDTAIYGARGAFFIAAEIITTCYLIFAFASMTETFLKKGRCGANPFALVLMLGMVSAVFFLRLSEYKNWLIAIFAVLTLLIWMGIFIWNRRSIRASSNPFDFTLG